MPKMSIEERINLHLSLAAQAEDAADLHDREMAFESSEEDSRRAEYHLLVVDRYCRWRKRRQ
jgi:hypothetical protein